VRTLCILSHRRLADVLAAVSLMAGACADDEGTVDGAEGDIAEQDSDQPDVDAIADTDTEPDADGSAAADAGTADGSSEPITCDGLFGQPNASTGLDESQCAPVCSCSGGVTFEFPDYGSDDLARLRAWVYNGDPALEQVLPESPYANPEAWVRDESDEVCAFTTTSGSTYALSTFASAAAATAAGAQVTHGGKCGMCSNLADLSAYLENPDLTTPVRDCGLLGISEGEAANMQCLRDLGFSEPCARVWYYNTVNTRDECGGLCFAALDDPFNLPDGSLNPCLQCDEDISGPVFKAAAGRTRRNSGLATAICRPCSEVLRIVHDYGTPTPE